jgi:hypothetical protein
MSSLNPATAGTQDILSAFIVAPGDCTVVVTTPPGVALAVHRQALVAVLVRLVTSRPAVSAGVRS